MNEKVKKYLASLGAMNAAEADFSMVKQECARKINEAREAYKLAAEAHGENGGSISYDTGCGQFTFCAPLPDYMVEYYAEQAAKKGEAS
jgi:hypothetical protein